jgi:hypothetical protein
MLSVRVPYAVQQRHGGAAKAVQPVGPEPANMTGEAVRRPYIASQCAWAPSAPAPFLLERLRLGLLSERGARRANVRVVWGSATGGSWY